MRQDILVWAISVLYIGNFSNFSLKFSSFLILKIMKGAIMGGMFWWGSSQNWSAEKPILSPNPERFWPKPDRNSCGNITTDEEKKRVELAPIRGVSKDCYSKWYYWQLPEDEADAASRKSSYFMLCCQVYCKKSLLNFSKSFCVDYVRNSSIGSLGADLVCAG